MVDELLKHRTQLARPDVSTDEAQAVLAQHYGLSGDLAELGSQQDRNFRVDADEGRFVLKVTRVEYARVEIEAQNAALRHVGAKPGAPKVPEVVPSLGGEDIVSAAVREETYHVRLLTYLEGSPLTRRRHLGAESVAALGDVAGQLAAALKDFDHPGLERELQWDLRRAGPVALHLLSAMADVDLRKRIAEAMIGAMRKVQPLMPELRLQAVHQDVTDDNVVSRVDSGGRLIPDGVIDFGDVLKGWVVADLAVTCASLLHHAGGDPFTILPAVKAFHAAYPLTDAELTALWPLIVARACVLVASSAHQLEVDPENAYAASNAAHEREIFDVAVSVPNELMEHAIRKAVARERQPAPSEMHGRLLPDLNAASVGIVDLSVLGPHLPADRWHYEDTEALLLQSAARAAGAAATRYGEYRLTETRLLQASAPRTFALHVDLCLHGQTAVHAPFAGRLHQGGGKLILSGEGLHLHLYGVEADDPAEGTLEPGARIGLVPGEPSALRFLRVQLCTVLDMDPPAFAAPHQAEAWGRLCPSPETILGFGCDAPLPDAAALLQRRHRHYARPQKNYYRMPPQIERGWKEHLFDLEGRAYLDMVNNVTLVGHGHSRLSAAVGRQWSLLNTNSRFHYAAVAEFSERLAALAPEGLDTVFLVNSGSEANDLALRLAWAASGARNVVSLLEAYHGWTVASDAVSTSIADNPQALTTRPDWVHPVVSPNTYRGPFRGEGSTGDYVDAVSRKLRELDEKGGKLAGFISEPVYGNAGGIPLPPGYLEAVYALVRARGGVCIADEVQVGYGRLGHYFWGFEQQGVVPDIITVAKGMGNGHPLGAVITRRTIADALEEEGYFFSSAGGSPVSSVVGLTVLDILHDEALTENARSVGDYLKGRLEALVERFPLAGAVHGMGLYLGVEFVRDRETLEPATEETAAICDRLLDLGVIMQPTGDHLNVLKIKPPLCLARESADFFADTLGRVLEEGW
ncbi:aminotransferase [Sinorhizobium medicae]|uniref:Aminotransferase class-III n=2 Tax=Sinorhizobium medicae TaxID=110321 RepID=A6UCN0_SINMW|nr:aminotransferase [Sinorhizobium medicae]ABR61410.1 aminotransferase class-III [Sinorhizobium medicae WSM419]MDX0405133.1 aminotransferase [Sinorhizobium medicae]MDX0410881.1 aminotransferase [Sinorhizobium medicae]MDX0417309.1 aminotransferase [Sinorhizobium medicae]MDX0435034.1 aminotransferase [Sinorhizobium medicae]